MASAHRVPTSRAGTIGRLAAVSVLVVVLLGGLAYAGLGLLGRGSGGTPSRSSSNEPPAAAAAAPLAADPQTSESATDGYGVSESPAAADPTPATSKARSASPAAKKTTKPAEAAGQREQILALVNTERAKAGCVALTADGRLRAAADAHSADMAANNYFSHTSRNGTEFSTRVTRAGYRWSNVGENIAAGQPTPQAVMQAWMNSSGHRANILNCKFRNLGVGIANRGSTIYWTQDFGTLL